MNRWIISSPVPAYKNYVYSKGKLTIIAPAMVAYLILVILIVVWPSDAFAWGPGTHLEVATSLLKNAAAFSPVVASLMRKYRGEFVYGMVSADVLVGKKYAGYHYHSHNWRVGWQILEGCTTDQERASAYGYLAHLAADITAHNYYIPYMVVKSFDAKMKNHTYWELRFDVHVKPSTWDEAKNVIKGDFSGFDNLLETTLKRPIFSFRTNKRIFSTILLLQKFKQLRQTVEIHSKFSQWPLTGSEVQHYKFLVMKMAREFLIKLEGANCLLGDPSGMRRLKYAGDTRKSLKRLVSRGLVGKADVDRFIKKLRRELKETVLEPDASLPESYEVM